MRDIGPFLCMYRHALGVLLCYKSEACLAGRGVITLAGLQFFLPVFNPLVGSNVTWSVKISCVSKLNPEKFDSEYKNCICYIGRISLPSLLRVQVKKWREIFFIICSLMFRQVCLHSLYYWKISLMMYRGWKKLTGVLTLSSCLQNQKKIALDIASALLITVDNILLHARIEACISGL